MCKAASINGQRGFLVIPLVGHGTSCKLFNPPCSHLQSKRKAYLTHRVVWIVSGHDKDSVNTQLCMRWLQKMCLPWPLSGQGYPQRASWASTLYSWGLGRPCLCLLWGHFCGKSSYYPHIEPKHRAGTQVQLRLESWGLDGYARGMDGMPSPPSALWAISLLGGLRWDWIWVEMLGGVWLEFRSLVSFFPSLSSWEGNFFPYHVQNLTDSLQSFLKVN